MTPDLRTCLWMKGDGVEAAEFYVSLLPDSRIERMEQAWGDDPPLVILFRLAGVPYMILNVVPSGGMPSPEHSWAASISVMTPDQAETDRLWAALAADGGQESMCGWVTDRFGLSWQIVPEALPRMLEDPDRAAATRAREAMFKMRKIDIAALEAAFNGE